jgi:hypothetical protein
MRGTCAADGNPERGGTRRVWVPRVGKDFAGGKKTGVGSQRNTRKLVNVIQEFPTGF